MGDNTKECKSAGRLSLGRAAGKLRGMPSQELKSGQVGNYVFYCTQESGFPCFSSSGDFEQKFKLVVHQRHGFVVQEIHCCQKDASKSCNRIKKISDQKVCNTGQSHQMWRCVPVLLQPQKQRGEYCGRNLLILVGTRYHLVSTLQVVSKTAMSGEEEEDLVACQMNDQSAWSKGKVAVSYPFANIHWEFCHVWGQKMGVKFRNQPMSVGFRFAHPLKGRKTQV